MTGDRQRAAAVAGGAAVLAVIGAAAGIEASLSVSGTVPKLLTGAGAGLAVAFAALVMLALGLVLRGVNLMQTAGSEEEERTREQS